MNNQNTIETKKNDKQIYDNALIAKLRYELEECQTSNMRLKKVNIWQEQRIETQSEMIDSAIKTATFAMKKIKRLESEIKNQDRTLNFLNDWKFIDHQFQTNIKATCEN